MDDKIEKEIIEEGYTEFGSNAGGAAGPYYYPTGAFGRFFAKFFATKAAPVVAKELNNDEQNNYDGDAIISQDSMKPENPHSPSILKTAPTLPKVETSRRARYADYETMDEYPELGTAFDMYADDCTQLGFKNENWTIDSDNQMVVDELNKMFDEIDLSRFLWDASRNTVKYGDCFLELVVDLENPEAGVQRIKVLDPRYILRVENNYGYLTDFLQEIPEGNTDQGMFGYQKQSKYVKLDRHQIVHMRLHTSHPSFYPYGKSIAALCHRTFRSLKLMEDAMLIYRLSRAPERRIFYIDVGNLPASRSEMYIERLKEKFKKEKFYDVGSDTVDARYNPMSADEDFFVPLKGGSGTKIETLPGAQNLGEVEDVSYFRDKLLTALKIPKDYFVEKEGSGERKANLAQLDVKFARVILRVQKSIELGLESIAKRHLQLKGFPASLIDSVKIKLPEPSDMFAKRKLDIDEQRVRVIQGVQQLGLLPKETIYKEYFHYTDNEVKDVIEKMKKEEEEMAEQGQSMPSGGAAGAGPGYGEAGGQEGAENVAPTANEDTVSILTGIKDKLILEENSSWKEKALSRVIKKQKIKEEAQNIDN